MELFVKRFEDRIQGIIQGPDRMLFRGTLRSISYLRGMEAFLRSQRIMNQSFPAFAKQATGQIRQHAEEFAERNGRHYHYLGSSSDSKEDLARTIMESDGITEGLICVLGCVEPCQTFEVHRNREQRTADLVIREGKCLHLYFYFVDPEFGFMHIRLQTWFPFTIQVCLNGREWLARRMDRAGIDYQRRDNCFTRIGKVTGAQRMLDSLTTRRWVRRLNAWARRVNPWLQTQPVRSLRGYYWTMRQDEYATDVMFRSPNRLAEIYPALLRHVIENFHTEDILRFLGHPSPCRFRGAASAHLGRRWEGVRVKHRVDENSIKMYDKQGSVLRVETTMNNPRRFRVRRRTRQKSQPKMAWLPMRKGVVDLRRRHQLARAANGRYLNALSVVGEHAPCHRVLDAVTQPVVQAGRRYRPLRPIAPDNSTRFAAMSQGQHLLYGFRNRDLYPYWNPPAGADAPTRIQISASISRWLRLCRAHGLIRKVPASHYYRTTQKGHQIMTTALNLRRADVAALAA